jgi:invasion protein IalB
MRQSTSKVWLLASALILASAAAQAQAPQRTTATYGDWLVRCEMQGGNPPQKSCDVAIVIPAQGQSVSPVAQVLIARPNKKEPMRLVLQLQANVLVAPGVKLVYDDKQPPIPVSISRCFPAACFASGPLTDDTAKKLRSRTEPGQVEFKDGNEKDVRVAVSFNGFAAAFDAWQKE